MKKSLVFLLVMLLAISVMVGCGTDKGSSDKLKKVSIQIDGAAVPYYAPLYIAQEKGFFKEEGLDVEFFYAAAADIVKNVASGNVEFGFPNADSVIAARAQDIPVKVIHTTYQKGLGSTLFKKDSGINTPADLKGKTIAITSFGSPNYIQLQVMLKQAGLSIDDVNIKIVGTGAIVNALVTDQVDAITFSMLRKFDLEASGVEVNQFLSDDFLPSHGNVLVTSEKLLNEDKETALKFTRALNKGLQYIIDGNVEEAVDLSIEKYATTFADKRDMAVKIIKEVFIPYLWQSDLTNSEGLGAADLDRWQKSIDILKEYEVIDKDIKASDFVVNLK
jgi:NitT/TauT family transport system substrate-binding protein